MVARGASAAGPVLLACRQWDPRGLARRLPSLGAGAWRSAPLLLWRGQCPAPVCAALAAGAGGSGPVPGFVSSPFPPSRPAFPALCVPGRPVWVSLILARWYAIPCRLCVPQTRSVCLLVFPACPLCVCALALSRRPRPPSSLLGLVWRAHLARSRCWALVGPFHAVRAPPRVLPRSRAPFGLLGGAAARSCLPLPCLGLRAPRGVGAGVGTRHQPHRARSCVLGLRAVWAARGRPGGAPLAWVRGVRGRALSHPRPLVLWGVRPGPTTHWLWVRGMRAWGPVTNPTARALASWLCALWGWHEDAWGGGAPLAWASGIGTSPTPDRPSFGACGRGPLPTGLWVLGVRAWGRVTHLKARAVASRLCALSGRHGAARGGRLLHGCGASGVGRSPTPDHSSLRACGRGPLPTGSGCGGCGRGDPSPTPQHALLRAGFARCGGGMRVPGGGTSCPGVWRPGSGALPFPTTRPLGRAAGAHYPLAVGAGDAGVGTRHQPHSARSCELALRAMGAACGCPWRAPLAWVWGVRGRALFDPQTPFFLGVRPGPTTRWL